MKIEVIVSRQDEAGMNIANYLDKVNIIEEETIYFKNNINADLIIFATKHFSKQGEPCFSCHVSGNWGENNLGGNKKRFSYAPCFLLRETLFLLNKESVNLQKEIFQEVTHHGPTIDVPSLFIEIGSRKKEWVNKENGMFIANVINSLVKLLSSFNNYSEFENYYKNKNNGIIPVLGLGGLHHTPNFKKLILEGKIALGHVCAKYNLNSFSKETIMRALEANIENIELVVLDWKGLGNYKQKVVEILDENKIKWVKIKEIK